MHAMQFEVWRTLILDAHRPIRVTAMPHTMQGQADARARARDSHKIFIVVPPRYGDNFIVPTAVECVE